jgi:nitroreductase
MLQAVSAETKLRKTNMINRRTEKALSEIVWQRRAALHFEPLPVREKDLKKILEVGLEAPSGFNLQPWRFIVVSNHKQRKRLREAAMGQAKVEEAPVVVVACGDTQGWRHSDLDEMLRLARDNGVGNEAQYESTRRNVYAALVQPGDAGGIRPDVAVWVNRNVMIALTTMMWMAEALGYDTAPLEGFSESKVRELLKIPMWVRVVALLAIGHGTTQEKPYGGRFATSRTVFAEEWGQPIQL